MAFFKTRLSWYWLGQLLRAEFSRCEFISRLEISQQRGEPQVTSSLSSRDLLASLDSLGRGIPCLAWERGQGGADTVVGKPLGWLEVRKETALGNWS